MKLLDGWSTDLRGYALFDRPTHRAMKLLDG
jgi:hypothetical protein